MFGWGSFDREVYDAAWNVSGESDAAVVFGSLAPVFWAFVGLETGAMIAGLVRDHDHDVPVATLGGVLIAGVVYIVSSVLVMGIVPAAELEASPAPLARSAEHTSELQLLMRTSYALFSLTKIRNSHMMSSKQT